MAASGVPADRAAARGDRAGWLEIWDLPLPVIAQVHGVCLAGGTQLAAICDVTFVADDARIGTPQLPLGAGYVASFWAWFVGPKKAKEVFFPTGAVISAAEAVAMGLFNRVVPAAELDAEVPGVRRRPWPARPRTSWPCRSWRSTARRRPRASARRCCRAPRSTPSPTPRRRCGRVNRYIGEHGLREALAAFQRGDLP